MTTQATPAPPWLTDAELRDATHRTMPSAQARVLAGWGVRFVRRPDGTLLVIRAALESALAGAAQNAADQSPAGAPSANGINWSKRA